MGERTKYILVSRGRDSFLSLTKCITKARFWVQQREIDVIYPWIEIDPGIDLC